MAAIRGDLRDPLGILTDPVVQRLIRPGEPVAIILALVLHFLNPETAGAVTGALTRTIPPGSYLILSVGSGDEKTGGQLTKEYTAGTLYNHSPAQIVGFFAGLELVAPGLTDARAWEPNLVTVAPPHQGGRILAAVGRKREATS